MFLWVGDPFGLQRSAVEALLARLRPSLAILSDSRRPLGAAALVDAQQGLYLAHNDAVLGDTVQGKVGDWSVSLRVVGEDARTGLVLLGIRSGNPASAPAIPLAETDPAPGTKICMILADGGFAGTFVGGQQFMALGETRSVVPVSELRFENPPQLVGGALVVTFDGKLLGAMGATVTRPGNSSAITLRALKEVKKGLAQDLMPRQSYNPGPLTVAYSPTLSLVRRSVTGLLSDDHRPEYAALGIQVADAPGGGGVIRRVVPNSPAGRSGVRVGDVLLALGDRPIVRGYDFYQALLNFRPGEKTTLRLRRDGTETQVDVTLARSKEELPNRHSQPRQQSPIDAG